MKTSQGGYMTKWQHVYNLQDSLYNIYANICLHDNMSTICMTAYIITVPNICLQYMTTCLQSAYQPIWQLCQHMSTWQHVYNLHDSLYNNCANICLHDNMSTICMTACIITVRTYVYMTTCLQSTWQHVYMTTCLRDNMSTWQNVYITICLHDNMSTWQHVYMKTCLHDNMSTWTHVYVTTCLHDIMSTWQYVYMTTCLHDNMSTWQHVQIIEINIVQCEYNSYTLLYTLEAINLYI